VVNHYDPVAVSLYTVQQHSVGVLVGFPPCVTSYCGNFAAFLLRDVLCFLKKLMGDILWVGHGKGVTCWDVSWKDDNHIYLLYTLFLSGRPANLPTCAYRMPKY
jgi:hypothetical protein